MAWVNIELARLLKVFDISIPRDIIGNLNYLFGSLGSLPQTIQNGGFEVDSAGNGQPDNIAITPFTGGVVTIDKTVSAEGSQCLKFVHPGGAGAGGGTAEFDYVPCSELQTVVLGWIHWATVAGMHNQVIVKFSDKNRVYLNSITLYDSTVNPTAPTYFVSAFTPPPTARFYKIDLVGGHSDTNVAGTAWFDAVAIAGLGATAGRRASGNISGSTLWGDWVDVASISIPMPFGSSSPVSVKLDATIWGDPGVEYGAYIRCRIGAYYSDEGSYQATGPQEKKVSLTLPFVADGTGRATLTLQLIGGSSPNPIYGRWTDSMSRLSL